MGLAKADIRWHVAGFGGSTTPWRQATDGRVARSLPTAPVCRHQPEALGLLMSVNAMPYMRQLRAFDLPLG